MASDLFISQTRSRLDQQEANFEAEIRKVEEKISKEKKAEADLIKLQAQRAHVDESAAEAKRAEDKILRGTDKLHHHQKLPWAQSHIATLSKDHSPFY